MTKLDKFKTTEYYIWTNMHSRCRNSNVLQYKDYGGRGISVCDRWSGKQGFNNFLDDMGSRPTNLTLERIDSNKGYEPSNCKWASWVEQQNNRRNNKKLTFNGKTMGISQWARELGINRTTLSMRLQYGWSTEETLTS